jgi:lipopolysaccharide export LptBFGC system permease protein LptF
MRLLTTIVLIYAVVAPVQAGQAKARSWGELSQEVQPDWTLRMVLPDATVIEGKQAAFTPETLTLKVVKTSNKTQHPKGQITIPREQVKTLEIRKERFIFQPIGILVPVVIGAAVGLHTASDKTQMLSGFGGALEFLLIGVLGGTAGFFIGRAADRTFHTVAVKP